MSLYSYYLIWDANCRDDDIFAFNPFRKPAQARLNEAATYWSLAQELRTDHSRNLLIEDPGTSHRLAIATIDRSNQRIEENQLQSASLYVVGSSSQGETYQLEMHKDDIVKLFEELALEMGYIATIELKRKIVSSGGQRPSNYQSTAWRIRYQQFDICGICCQNNHTIMHCTSRPFGSPGHCCDACNVFEHDSSGCPLGGSVGAPIQDQMLACHRAMRICVQNLQTNRSSIGLRDSDGRVTKILTGTTD